MFRETSIAVHRAHPWAPRSEPDQTQESAPEQHEPAPPGEVDHERAGARRDEVLVFDECDQTLKHVDRADDEHQDPAKPIHPAIDLEFIITSQHEGRTGSSRGVDFGRRRRYDRTGGLLWQLARFTWVSCNSTFDRNQP